MKNSKLVTLICGSVAIAATAILYLLIFGNIFAIPMVWVSLLFLIVAEVIEIVKTISLNKSIVTQASIFTSGAHIGAVLVLSIIFIVLFPFSIKTYILLNILMLCVLTAVDVIILRFGTSILSSEKKLVQSQGVMDACYVKAQSLTVIYDQSNYKKDLVDIADLIKYSDNSELTGDENDIISKLEELEIQLKEGNNSASALITEIKNAIKLRTIKMKSIKRGGY